MFYSHEIKKGIYDMEIKDINVIIRHKLSFNNVHIIYPNLTASYSKNILTITSRIDIPFQLYWSESEYIVWNTHDPVEVIDYKLMIIDNFKRRIMPWGNQSVFFMALSNKQLLKWKLIT